MNKSENTEKIIEFARQEAHRLGNTELLPEHLMLGILRLGEGKAWELLMQAGLQPVELKRALDERLMQPEPSNIPATLSRGVLRIFRLIEEEMQSYCVKECGSIHLLMAMLRDRINVPAMWLEQYCGIDYECLERLYPKPTLPKDDSSILESLFDARPDTDSTDDIPENDTPYEGERPFRFVFSRGMPQSQQETPSSSTPMLDKYGCDLTKQAANGLLDPVEGRQNEIQRVAQVLARRKKNNPILIGEPGVGKSAIVEGLAQLIIAKQAPGLEDKRIISLDIASMVAGTTYRGQFEERMKKMLTELKQHPEVILFVDEIHTLMGAGNSQGALDAANILKPALARGEVQCVGATTLNEYRTSIEKDGALERRFQKVMVKPTNKTQTLSILHRLAPSYEKYHHVRYTDEALQAAVDLSDRYIADRAFPDKAIDVMDEAGAECTSRMNTASGRARHTVNKEDIARIVSRISGIPVQRVARSESEQLLRLSSVLKRKVVGQDIAVDTVVKAIQRARVGLRDARKPIGVFFFLGPTGVGKTYLAKCLAEEMFGSANAIIRFDMSEYMEKHTVSLLVGAPPGYLAHEDGGKLTEAVRRKPYSIVLFDEIEKAHPDIFNLLLQVMDEGRLTDRQGHEVDFRNTIIILTSNVGTRQLADFGSGVGFAAEENMLQSTDQTLTKALNRTFPPEFVNRLDQVVIFHPLSLTALAQILRSELCPLSERLAAKGYRLIISDATRKRILAEGNNPRFGARPLKRAIRQYIEDPITDQLLKGKIKDGKIKV